MLKVPYNTLATWSSKGKWKHRRLDVAAGAIDKGSLITMPTAKPLRMDGLTFEEMQTRYKDSRATESLRIAEVMASLTSDQLIAQADKVAKLDAVARKGLNLEEAKPSTVINIGFLQARPTESVPYLSTNQPLTIVESTGYKPVDKVIEAEVVESRDGASEGWPVAPSGSICPPAGGQKLVSKNVDKIEIVE